MEEKNKLYENIPEVPGVYFMKDKNNSLLYIGKAGNLKRRVSSYFLKSQDSRIQRLVQQIDHIDYEKTDTALEALILEARLIKKHWPPFNIKDKDNKSFLYIEISQGEYPKIKLIRASEKKRGMYFGPFVSASAVREALRFLRKAFPFSTHEKDGELTRPCLDYELGLCAGTCANKITKKEYRKIIRQFVKFLIGKKSDVMNELRHAMERESNKGRFEEAKKYRDRLFALQHLRDTAFITRDNPENKDEEEGLRIEGYDVSNISGTSAVSSMVVFKGKDPERSEYRKFRIKTVKGSNDVAMLEETLRRRFRNNWEIPRLILVDGGKSQVERARKVLKNLRLEIPIVGIAKGLGRKKNEVLGVVPEWVDQNTLERVRDEAHRFAIRYHREVRARNTLR